MPRGAFLPATLLILLGLWLYDPNTLTQATARIEQPAVDRVTPSHLTVVDGDTVNFAGQSIRLVGFDTPETYRAECASERRLGEAATDRLRDLARLMLDGRDVADIMVGEGLARRYSGGHRQSWC